MSDFLSEILAARRTALARSIVERPLSEVRAEALRMRERAPRHALRQALSRKDGLNVIAEIKRASPSAGAIRADVDPGQIAQQYASADAAAISVLTEGQYFHGSLEDLRAVRQAVSLPILRKDFILDDYQVYESAAVGADALLLIVAALDDHRLRTLRHLTEDELGMDALVEVHTPDELDRALASGATLIGVNNRNLHTLETSIETSIKLADLIHGSCGDGASPRPVRAQLGNAERPISLIAESGLRSSTDLHRLRALGYDGFLIGESLMRAVHPGDALRALIEPAREPVKIKICGITSLEDAFASAEADFLGFNFYPRSPRYIAPGHARDIIRQLPSSLTPVGVFVDEPIDSLRLICDLAGIRTVQLHGDEPPEYCAALADLTLIKAFPVQDSFDSRLAARYPVAHLMLDSHSDSALGGTGTAFDWSVAGRVRELFPNLFLAGGLAPDNVSPAIAAVQPYAVDACSRLELSPGRKDHPRVARFITAVRSTANRVGAGLRPVLAERSSAEEFIR